MVPPLPQETADPDSFHILIATDIHVGFAEGDPVRNNDSISAFDEVLQHAQSEKVDFILLGGDLFHENKPSRGSLHKTMSLIRKFCFNDRSVRFELQSDPALNFGMNEYFPHANYEDRNLNVGTPIFTISGNHDDVTGEPPLCALDLLHTAGLVNYFGKSDILEELNVAPLLLRKGSTHLAIYGFGNVRDERLHRMFTQGKVKFMQPPADGNCDWFKLLVLHQNRVKHGETNYIPEHFIPDMFDLVIWGHEHCSLIDPVATVGRHFFIMQPGSTIATSLCEAEAGDKHIAVLHVKGTTFKSSKIKLQSVRQYLYQEISLQDSGLKPALGKRGIAQVEEYLTQKFEDMLAEADAERCPGQPKEPLLRLKVDYSGGFETVSVPRFGHKFAGRVANPKDLLIWVKRREVKEKERLDLATLKELKEIFDSAQVEQLVKEYFAKVEDKKKMLLLTAPGMAEAVKMFVEKDEKESIKRLVDSQVKRSRSDLVKEPTASTEDALIKFLVRLRTERQVKAEAGNQEDVAMDLQGDATAANVSANEDVTNGDDDDEEDEDFARADRSAANGSASARPTAARGRGRGAKAAAKNGTIDRFVTPATPRGGRGKGRGRGGATTAKRGGKQRAAVAGSSEDEEDDLVTISDDSD